VLQGTPYLLEGPSGEEAASQLGELIDRVELLRRESKLDSATLDRLREEWQVEQIHETLGIEGNPLDVNETQLILMRGIAIPGFSARDVHEVLNMRAALDYLESLASSERMISEQEIREIHSLIVGDAAGAGSYRTTDVEISGASHKPPLAVAVPSLMEEATHWLAQTNAVPLLAATVTHAWVAHIHPFTDGNGRTARALMNLILIQAGYPIVLIRKNDRPRYYEALAASDDGDIAPLLSLVLKRSGDSLRQILRVRAATTGVTEAIQRTQNRITAEYEAWRQAMLLVVAELRREAEAAEAAAGGAIRFDVRAYDQVTLDDYKALLRRDRSGNGWLVAVRATSGDRRAAVLLWVGYRSTEVVRLAHVPETGPAILFSEANFGERRHPFQAVTEASPLRLREVVFDGDRFTVRSRWSGETSVARIGAAELAGTVITQVIDGYIGADIDRPGDELLFLGDSTRTVTEDGCQIRVRVLSVDDPLPYVGQYPPEPGERYVGVSIQLTNLSNRVLDTKDMIFVLADASGNLLEPYLNLASGELPPKLDPASTPENVRLVFGVATAIRTARLRFTPDFHSVTVEWTLERKS
jgi:Fic family protein